MGTASKRRKSGRRPLAMLVSRQKEYQEMQEARSTSLIAGDAGEELESVGGWEGDKGAELEWRQFDNKWAYSSFVDAQLGDTETTTVVFSN